MIGFALVLDQKINAYHLSSIVLPVRELRRYVITTDVCKMFTTLHGVGRCQPMTGLPYLLCAEDPGR